MSKNLYDDLDLLYREIWGRSLHHGAWLTGRESIDEARGKLIELSLDQLKPEGRIADIGCGYGILAHQLIEQFGSEVIANTLSEKQAAQIAPHPRLKILQGDWLQQQLEPESLEGAIAIESLSHFESFEDFLKHTLPALKPGGRLVICDWYSENGGRFLLRQLAATGKLPPWRSVSSLVVKARELNLSLRHSQDLSSEVAPTWPALFWSSIRLPFRRPGLIFTLLRKIIAKPSLLVAFPLLRLAYHTGDLEYQILTFQK